jgi:tetratricopeptide (TPR) repeat protein
MRSSSGHGWGVVAFVVILFAAVCNSNAADLEDAQQQFLSGDYSGCIATLEKTMADRAGGEDRHLLLSKALMTVGRYPDAYKAITNALEQEPWSIRLKWQARDVFLANGQTMAANQIVDDIVKRVAREPSSYRDAAALVIFGQAALLKNADPKRVLDQLFDMAKKRDPKLRETYLAAGNLALDKHDFALAAKKFEEGLKELPDDPDLQCGLAQAYEPSDSALAATALEAALKRNSNHIASLLMVVDHCIDAEDYEEAKDTLERIKSVNPWHPDAWSYEAVVAHLKNQSDEEKTARQTALKFWANNPRVDYLIGLKLSQKYRFAEGAAHQGQALKNDFDYLPAKAQLAHDLLRLGEETEGWKLADEVQKQDGYDVEAYNMVNLRLTMSKYTTLTNRDFLVRMSSREAALYGDQVLDLLNKERTNLCAKYEMELKRPTIVEIFAEQKDFAVRTFGMPGNAGYLGVCFGTVVTANSPAVQHGHPVNWQAVLYHEFCHVVTLQMTKNKMPRWLSEGISVYEEGQQNPAWGQRMTPKYREMILGDELTPVSKLSGAFLDPKSEMHLQFAYYESSLVVEFLVQKYGIEKLKSILRDLGEGVEINDAIAKELNGLNKLNELNSAKETSTDNAEKAVASSNDSTNSQAVAKAAGPLEQFEKDFAAFARERAEKLAPGLDFEEPEFTKAGSRADFRRRYAVNRERGPGSRDTNSVTKPTLRVNPSRPVHTNEPLPIVKGPAVKGETNSAKFPGRNAIVATNALAAVDVDMSPQERWQAWAKDHPTNFWVMTRKVSDLVEDKRWAEAKPILQQLVEAYPDYVGPDSAYRMLAAAHHAMGETNSEREVLEKFAARDDEAQDAYGRLMELGVASKDWPSVETNALRYLAVNPLVPTPYRYLAQASEQTKNPKNGISAYRALLELDPPELAETHFRLAQLLHRGADPSARRHVLQALEEAPRYPAALQLLLEINNQSPQANASGPAAIRKP